MKLDQTYCPKTKCRHFEGCFRALNEHRLQLARSLGMSGRIWLSEEWECYEPEQTEQDIE